MTREETNIKKQLRLFFNLSLPAQIRDKKRRLKKDFPKDSLASWQLHQLYLRHHHPLLSSTQHDSTFLRKFHITWLCFFQKCKEILLKKLNTDGPCWNGYMFAIETLLESLLGIAEQTSLFQSLYLIRFPYSIPDSRKGAGFMVALHKICFSPSNMNVLSQTLSRLRNYLSQSPILKI